MNVSTNGHDAAIESHLATSADVDMYRIEFQMGVVMRWQLCAPQNLNATFTVYDVNGNIKHEETASNCTYYYNNILSAGTYYV
ncbi:MAG: hypothetical protein IPN86_21095 [Saprospiraceae bacterium]|nr:hypothetical protein [Saprospiraceae bacterium]